MRPLYDSKMGNHKLYTVLIVVILVAIIWRLAYKKKKSFCSGPYNIQLYDNPYLYPWYVGRTMTQWDGDKRCMVNCSQWPCTVWCR